MEKTLDIYSLGLLLDRAFTFMMQRLNKKLKENGIDLQHSQFIVLKNVFLKEGISQTRLAIFINKDNAAINRSVKSLVEKGYLEIRRGDNKTCLLFPTDKALNQKDRLLLIGQEVINESLDGIPESRRKIGLRFLNKIYKNIK